MSIEIIDITLEGGLNSVLDKNQILSIRSYFSQKNMQNPSYCQCRPINKTSFDESKNIVIQ